MLDGSSFYFYVVAFVVFGIVTMLCRRRQQQLQQQQAVLPTSTGQTVSHYPQGGVPNAYTSQPIAGYATVQQFTPAQPTTTYGGSVPVAYVGQQQNYSQPPYAVAVPFSTTNSGSAATAHVQAAYVR